MSNVKILVCAHKKDFVKSDEVYMPIHAGKAISDVDLGFQGDDTGDNISIKNLNYCELTVLYWAWKNLKNADYIGLNHYRRYFHFSNHHFTRVCKSYSIAQFLKLKHTNFQLDKHLGKKDIILASPLVLPYSLAVEYSKGNFQYYEDYCLVKYVVGKLFPDYADVFTNVMEHNNKISYCNMFITKWEIFDAYCKWLFAILEEVEKTANIDDYSVEEARIFGYLGERLLNVYVAKNKLKVKYYPMAFVNDNCTDKSFISYWLYNFKDRLSFLYKRVRGKVVPDFLK
jgi:hypothetical protein